MSNSTSHELASTAYTLAPARTINAGDITYASFSLGGMIAEALAVKHPRLVRKLVLTGTGPKGGTDMDKVARTTYFDILRATLTRSDPKNSCSSTATPPASVPRKRSWSASKSAPRTVMPRSRPRPYKHS